jgi:type II secretory ATPase GspE/PulE/Tfp pilus assembly ATPase PilB-like protein
MNKPIGQLLVASGAVTPARVDAALQAQKSLKKKLGEILLANQDVREDDLLAALSQQIDLPVADRRSVQAPAMDLVRLIPEPFAREHLVLPLRREGQDTKGQGGKVEVAMADPENLAVLDNVRKLLKAEVVPLLAGPLTLEGALSRAYDTLNKSGEMEGVLSGLEFEIIDSEEGKAIDLAQKDIDEAPIVRLVNLMLSQAIKERATDIHIEPQPDRLVIRYRVDGALREAMSAPSKSHPGVVSRLKVMSRLNIAESRLPQDGRFTLKSAEREVDVRVSVLPSVLGEKIVLRLLDKGFFSLTLEKLGMGPEDLTLFRRCIRHPYGIVIITGPTGSGKSTTLYSAIQEIQSSEDNIVTVEDPVEYQVPGITQVAVNEGIGLSFGATLRSILRQDPDKVLIGEIRDRETADIAMKLALTGHLVFTTLHANDTPGTITRLIDIGVPSFLVGSSLVMVMAQRLMRKICEDCKEPYAPTSAEVEWLGGPAAVAGRYLFHGKGCPRCRNTGYYGRTGIFELMPINPALRKLILAGADQEALRQQALLAHMRTLRHSALEKLYAGVTSVHEVLKTTVEEG